MKYSLMKEKSCLNSKALDICSYGIFVIAMLYSISMVFFGLDFKDTFYWCCHYQYSGKTLVFVPFTQGVYLLIRSVFGDHVIAYRIFNWLVYFAADVLVWFFLKICGLGSKRTRLLLLSLSVAFIPVFNTNVFNGNQFSALFLICIFFSLYLYEYRSRQWLLGVVASLTLCILSRFPNVVVIPMIMFAWIFVCKNWKDYLCVVGAILVSVLLYFLVCSILFRGIHNYLDAISLAFELNHNSEEASHSIETLLEGYLHSIKDMMSYIKYLSIIALIPLLIFFCRRKCLSFIIPFVFLVAQIVFVNLRVEVVSDLVHYFLNLYFCSSVCVVTSVICVLALLRHSLKDFGWGIMPLLYSLCAAAGSDTGLFLITAPLYAFTPFLLLKMISMLRLSTKREAIWLAVFFMGLAVGSACYVRNGMMVVGIFLIVVLFVSMWFVPAVKIQCNSAVLPAQDCVEVIIWGVVALMLMMDLTMSVYAKMHKSFHDKPIRDLTCLYDSPKLKYIWTNSESVGFVEEVLDDYRELSKEHDVVFYGNVSFIFSYLTEQAIVPNTDFMQDISESNINALNEALSNRPVVFLIPNNPAVPPYYLLDDYEKVGEMLCGCGYECEKRGIYAVYKPVNNL